MKKFFLTLLNDVVCCIVIIMFGLSAIKGGNTIVNCFLWFGAYMTLDLHTAISRKLGFPNNIFIK